MSETEGMEAALISRGDRTPVFNVRGEIYVILSGGDDDGWVVPGDFNGNGILDLAIEQEAVVETLKFVQPHCLPLDTILLEADFQHCLAADTNGDGRDEFLNVEGSELATYRPRSTRGAVTGWFFSDRFPSAAVDINGDNRDELICIQSALLSDDLLDPRTGAIKDLPEDASDEVKALWTAEHSAPRGGWFNPGDGSFTDMQFPAANYRYNLYTGEHGEAGAIDLDGDGLKEVITKASMASHIMAFNASGEPVYHEEFGGAALSLGVLRGDGVEHLAVLLADRLLVWP